MSEAKCARWRNAIAWRSSRRVRLQYQPDRRWPDRGARSGGSPDLSAGNSIHTTRDCPFLQIGETKYGKPILDRGFNYDFIERRGEIWNRFIDATESNLAVGPPIDLLCYETDSLLANSRMRFDQTILICGRSDANGRTGIIKLVKEMPAPGFTKPSLAAISLVRCRSRRLTAHFADRSKCVNGLKAETGDGVAL